MRRQELSKGWDILGSSAGAEIIRRIGERKERLTLEVWEAEKAHEVCLTIKVGNVDFFI